MADGEGIFLPFGIQDEFTKPLESMARASKELYGVLDKLRKNADSTAKSITHNEKASTGWAKALKTVEAGMKKINAIKVKDVISGFQNMSVAGLAVGEGFREGLQESFKFERSMIDLKYSGSLTKDELEALGNNAIKLAGQTKFARSAFLQSEILLKKLGATSKEAMTLAGTSSAYALTNQLALTDAVEGSARVAKLYYKDVNRISDAQNIMSLASREANLPITELTGVMENLGSILGPSGAKLNEVASMLTVLTQAGLTASEAQMAIRMTASKAAMAHLSFGTALDLVRKKFKEARTEGEKMNVLAVNLGPRALKLANFFEADQTKLSDLAHHFDNAADKVRGLNEEMAATPDEKIALFQNRLKNTFATLSTPLAKVVGVFGSFLDVVSKVPGLLTTMVGALTALSIVPWILKIVSSAKLILTVFKPIATLFGDITAVFGGGVWGLIAGRIFVVVGAIVGLYHILKLLWMVGQQIGFMFQKKGNDFLSPYAKARQAGMSREQALNAAGGTGNATLPGKGISGAVASSGAASGGIHVGGDLHIHTDASKIVGGSNTLVSEIRKQARQRGRNM